MILHFNLWWGGVGGGEVAKVSLGRRRGGMRCQVPFEERGGRGRESPSKFHLPPLVPQCTASSSAEWLQVGRRAERRKKNGCLHFSSLLFQFDSLPWAPRIVVAWRAWAREERGRRTWRHTECHKNSRYCSSDLLAQTRTQTT